MEIMKLLKDYGIIEFVKKNCVTLMVVGFVLTILSIIIFYHLYNYMMANMKKKESFTSNDDVRIIMFHVDWCPHCKKALPDWNSFKSEYNNLKINNKNIIIIDYDMTNDSDEKKELMNKYKVEGYPTILLEYNNKVVECEVKPTKENLVNFVNNNV